MKISTFLSSLFFFIAVGTAMGQTPQSFKYQAVARNASGNPLAEQLINVRISIRKGGENGSSVYAETHAGETNAFGLFNLNIGEGNPASGDFEGINWGDDTYFLRIEIDPAGGNNFQLLGAQQLLSVPYALFAENVADKDDADADPTNELQYLNLSGNQLSIGPSGSASVLLPPGFSLWSQAGLDIFYDLGNVFVDRTLIVGDDIVVQNLENPNQAVSAEIVSYSDGEGQIYTYGANGSTNVGLMSTDNFNDGGVSLYDQSDVERLAMGITDGNAGFLETYAPNGSSNVIISSLSSNQNNGWLGIQDKDGYTQVYMTTLSPTGEGYLELVGPNGNQNIQLTSSSGNSNQGYISVSEDGGYEAASMSVLSSGQGFVATVGSNGNDNVQLSTLNNYPNNGFVAVINNNGNTRAGAFIDQNGNGIVFGDVKNFRMPHPNAEEKEIWYASLEGPEAAAYTRGTAQLVNGETFVEFPEHFRMVANPATMTVMLTPLSADTRGLAVVEKAENGFRVKELMNGAGTFGFDWEVKCVRKGYENYQVVRDVSYAQTAARPRAKAERPGRDGYVKRTEKSERRGVDSERRKTRGE
jgi:hypothetical protein